MKELQRLLAKRETAVTVNFDHLKHRVRCYAHIINICSSHIISSITSVSEQYLSKLKVPTDSNCVFRDDSEDELDQDGIDFEDDIVDELKLGDWYDDDNNPDLKEWFAGFKRDPLKRARRLIGFLRSSDQRREQFSNFIRTGNERAWFTRKDSQGKRVPTQIVDRQLLRDVKTRWDSVYSMLERLRDLRPVRSPQQLDSVTAETD